MSLESWKSFFEIGGVVLLFLTFAFGTGALLTGKVVNQRQENQLRRFDSDLTTAKTALSEQQERTAAMELQALSLQKQLVSQGSRAALLYGKNRERLVDRLKPFQQQKVEIRFCRVSFNQFVVDNDTMAVAMLLQSILSRDARWAVNPLVMDNCSGTGIQVSVNPEAVESTRKASDALWAALHEIPLTMVGDKPFVVESPRPSQPKMYDCGATANCEGKEVIPPPLDHDTIVVTVLSHP